MPVTITTNIASHLAAMAERLPDTPAVIAPHRDRHGLLRHSKLTFRELDDSSSELARGFERIGIRRGVRAALMVPPSLDFFAVTFALFKLGAVPVLIDPGIGLKNFGNCLKEAEPTGFIGIPKAQAARVLLRWGRKTITLPVAVGTRWFWGGHTLGHVRELGAPPAGEAGKQVTSAVLPEPGETAAILFTSGSTGAPKGVIYTHAMFSAQVEQVRQLYRIQPGEIDLPTFPLFALFGPALGMTEVLPEMDFTRPAQADPEKLVAAIERFCVTNMFGSPALINRLGRHGEAHSLKLPTLRRAISAGAPVPAKVLARFAKLLPEGAQVFTPYGATECLPVASIGSEEIINETRAQTELGKGVCVGKPVPGLTLKIVRITEEPIAKWSDDLELPVGQIGEIAVQATQASRAYFNREQATALAKIPCSSTFQCREDSTGKDRQDPTLECRATGFLHRMGDVGYLDEQGRIWFCGRKSHRVITRAGTLFTIPCEAIFNTHPGVFRSALVGVPRGGDVEPVICIEREGSPRGHGEAKLREELLALGAKFPHTQGIRTVLFHPAFPVDIRHNAKIFREKLAVWAKGRLG